jgi:hypothetical protein
MAAEQTIIESILENPSESLNLEVKRWLDLDDPEGIAKFIKTVCALRNRNGGYFLMGLDNATLNPVDYTFSKPFRDQYHADVIQGLISKYCASPFEVEIEVGQKNGRSVLVVSVPVGVKTPTMIKSPLINTGGAKLLEISQIYFRTLNSNGTASSACLAPKDIEDLMEICFENREADIGRFLRRHMTGAAFQEYLHSQSNAVPVLSLKDKAWAVVDDGLSRLAKAIATKPLPKEQEYLINAFSTTVGLYFDPQKVDAIPSRKFLDSIRSRNPQLTGWPIWLDAQDFQEQEFRPRVIDGAWDSFIRVGSFSKHGLDYMSFHPAGKFFLHRVMQEDTSEKVERGSVLDPVLLTYRVAECIIVGLAFSKIVDFGELSRAVFAFRFKGLENRKVSPWANRERYFSMGGRSTSYTEKCDVAVEVPADTPANAVAPYVHEVMSAVLVIFDGFQLSEQLVEDCVKRLIERRM